MDENQTKGTFSDSIIKYCVDKFVEFFAKHWLKVLILIALLAMENNRRFLGFVVNYITGKFVVKESDSSVLLDVVPILVVSYLAYQSNKRINEMQEQEIKFRAEKEKEIENLEKTNFLQQSRIIRIEYEVRLNYFKEQAKIIEALIYSIVSNGKNEIFELIQIVKLVAPKLEDIRVYNEKYTLLLLNKLKYDKCEVNNDIDIFTEFNHEVYIMIDKFKILINILENIEGKEQCEDTCLESRKHAEDKIILFKIKIFNFLKKLEKIEENLKSN
ncbi:MAG: hypothetical protein N4A40_09370 [Tissierellales bacterium]|jgi:hypothetical protein|nr:hypothetical protein [Tissierellales bacterium]